MSTNFLDVRFGIFAASDKFLSYGFRHVVLLFLVGAHVLPQIFRHASLEFRPMTRCPLSVGGLNQSTQHVFLTRDGAWFGSRVHRRIYCCGENGVMRSLDPAG